MNNLDWAVTCLFEVKNIYNWSSKGSLKKIASLKLREGFNNKNKR